MLQASKISKTYGDTPILLDISFVINRGDRVGLVGENGCGKTTLLRILTGLEQPDSGSVHLDGNIGYLEQALAFEADETVEQVLLRINTDHSRAWADMQKYAQLMANPSADTPIANLTEAYANAETRFEAAGGYQFEARLNTVLSGLNLDEISRQLPVELLSGGQKTRLGLARLLINQPSLLLLDEPTNHLDIDALTWLEAWLGKYDGAVLIVSHDRAFLDAVTNRTLVINPQSHTLRDFAGNYSAYMDTTDQEREKQWQAYQMQQQEIAQLQNAARHLRGQAIMKRGGKADSGDKFAKGHFANRSAGSVGRAKQIERRLEQLQTDERVDKPGQQWQLSVQFSKNKGGARQVLRLEHVSMAFGDTPLFSNLSLNITHGQRVALTGPNGAGKTTLLRLIAGELSPTSGEIRLGANVKVGYFSQEQETLTPGSTPYDTIWAASENMEQSEVRSFLHRYLFSGDEVFKTVETLSFGERARLMLALLVVQGCNFLLLDEPVNHLDIPSRERFEQALSQFPGTLLAVSHDRAFMQRVATVVWELRRGAIKQKSG